MASNSILTAFKGFTFWALLSSSLLGSSIGSLLIESLESKTKEDKPVYNQIAWFQYPEKDVWMMNQSHQGLQPHVWDRLAIVIDRTASRKTARFLQLPPGELKWSDELLKQQVSNRVSCFLCHTNGPRVIRPNLSGGVSLSAGERLRLFIWNLRIKSYGRVKEDPIHSSQDLHLDIPFRHRGSIENETLDIPLCKKCHNESGWISRGQLTRQNAMTIEFMVKNQFMPPLGLSLSDADRKKIEDFVRGF